jgi:hypothetical protein
MDGTRRTESEEERLVVALPQRRGEVLQRRDGREKSDDFGCFNDLLGRRGRSATVSAKDDQRRAEQRERTDLLLQLLPLQCQGSSDHHQLDKLVVLDQLGSSEGRKGVKEELSAGLEVADGEEIQPFVGFQTVPSVPVASRLDETARSEGISSARTL